MAGAVRQDTDPLAAFDLLATMVAVVRPDGLCLHANASFENLLGVARRALLGTALPDWLAEPQPLRETLAAVAANRIASGRFDAQVRRPGGGHPELLPVHVIVAQTDDAERVLVEMIEIEQQTRQDREERTQGQAQANKELVRNLAHEIKNPRGLTVRRDYDTSIPEFRGDREQLIQAVLNIAHNAVQALAERIAAGDAELIFRTRIARQVTIGKQRWRLALELHIEDNGPGVPEVIRERIFFPLVTGREGGSGLGLTLAQTFVQQHQGTIECASEPGRTVFTVLIPLP
jgi:two-component system nitrogen regulation sensor histidine kinase GlnL